MCLIGWLSFSRRIGLLTYDFFILRFPFIDDGVVASESEKVFGPQLGYFFNGIF